MLEHVRAPHKFLAMLKEVFGEAKAYIEVPSWDWIAENKAFFDITYEHVNYFSRNSLRALFDGEVEAGLCFNDQYQYVVADISKVAPPSRKHTATANGYTWPSLTCSRACQQRLRKSRAICSRNRICISGAPQQRDACSWFTAATHVA